MRGGTTAFAVGVLAALSSCEARRSTSTPGSLVLLYVGEGTSKGDVAAWESVLERTRTPYSVADAPRLDAIAPEELATFKLLLVPGGNFETMGKALQPGTSAKVKSSVERGLRYLGICAGAFFAGASPYNGLDLTGGVRFAFYSAEAKGLRKAALRITTPQGPALEQYWEDGPELSGWGDVIARYPDGTPAAVQKGGVLLVGVHPEAPESWRHGMTFETPVHESNAWAEALLKAALEGRPLPGY